MTIFTQLEIETNDQYRLFRLDTDIQFETNIYRLTLVPSLPRIPYYSPGVLEHLLSALTALKSPKNGQNAHFLPFALNSSAPWWPTQKNDEAIQCGLTQTHFTPSFVQIR